jgi:hypothetical protein
MAPTLIELLNVAGRRLISPLVDAPVFPYIERRRYAPIPIPSSVYADVTAP